MDFTNFFEKQKTNVNSNKIDDIDYSNLKRGVMVKIVHKENSYLNSYKGQIGEIISFNKQKNIANIFLHASSTFKKRQFPLDHLQLLVEKK